MKKTECRQVYCLQLWSFYVLMQSLKKSVSCLLQTCHIIETLARVCHCTPLHFPESPSIHPSSTLIMSETLCVFPCFSLFLYCVGIFLISQMCVEYLSQNIFLSIPRQKCQGFFVWNVYCFKQNKKLQILPKCAIWLFFSNTYIRVIPSRRKQMKTRSASETLWQKQYVTTTVQRRICEEFKGII